MVHAAVARALRESFPCVRVFHSVEGWGYHFLATDHALPKLTGAELAQRLPPKAAADLMEWGPQATPEGQFNEVLGRELSTDQMISEAPNAPALQDDRLADVFGADFAAHHATFHRAISYQPSAIS